MEPLIISQVKEHLAQGDLENAIKLLSTYADSNLKGSSLNKLKNDIIHLQGQMNEVKNAELKGLIAFEQAERNRNMIRLSVLNLTDVLTGFEDAPDNLSAATGSPPPSGGGITSKPYFKILVGAGIVVILLALSPLFCTDEPATTDTENTEQFDEQPADDQTSPAFEDNEDTMPATDEEDLPPDQEPDPEQDPNNF